MEFPHELELRYKRRRIIGTATILILLAGLVMYFFMHSGGMTGGDEPRYRGRYLSAWLDDYANPLRGVRTRADLGKINLKEKLDRSRQAVLAIGTNGIPTLLKL